MPFSKTEVANMALSNLGVGVVIDNIDTDPSPAASACRTYYQVAFEFVLSAFDWWFARKFVALGLVGSNPNSEWAKSYRWPTDCLKLLRLLSGKRIDDEDTAVDHVGGVDAQGRLIFTDLENAEAAYTFLPVDLGNCPAYFVIAFSWKLAELIASRLTKEDPAGRAKEMAARHFIELEKAKVNALEDERLSLPKVVPASIRARR